MSDGEYRMIVRDGKVFTEIDGMAVPATEVEADLWENLREARKALHDAKKILGEKNIALAEARTPYNVTCSFCGHIQGFRP